MHNSISSNQLAEWKHANQEELDKENDYYNCIIDAEENHSDKRICTEILQE